MPDITNLTLLRDRLRAYPEQLAQDSYLSAPNAVGATWELTRTLPPVAEWDCGTTACAAGHAILLAGWSPELRPYYPPAWIEGSQLRPDYVATMCTSPEHPTPWPIDDVAMTWLGLTTEQAKYLFDPANYYEDVMAMLDDLIDNPEDWDE